MTPSLSRGDLTRLALWGLTLQASYDTARRQAMGVCAAMTSLVGLWPDPQARRQFLQRHLEPMNTNPGMAGFLLGALARLEERAALGEADAIPKLQHLRRLLEGPLAATGDAILWAGLRPLGGLVGAILAWIFGWVGPIAFLVLYNAVHLSVRVGGVFWGHARGERVHEVLRARWVSRTRTALRWGIPVSGLVLLVLASTVNGGAGWTVLPAALVGLVLGRRSTVRGGLLAGGAIMVGLILSLVFARPSS